MLFRPIHHTFAPLGDRQQIVLAAKRGVMPWTYRSQRDVRALEAALAKRYGGEAITFGSGREALLALMRALKLQPEEEVIVQGYTCVVVPNAIHAAGMKTVYADIDQETLNLNLEETEAAITPKTRAIICQHTFGNPADTAALRQLCDSRSLTLIEDCAHILPDQNGPSEIGRLGDAMLLSFGRDKAISGISGGAIVTRNTELATELRRMQTDARKASLAETFALLQYPLLYAIARPLYGIGIGKALLVAAAKIRLLVPILTRAEKNGSMPKTLHKMPGACAALALQQLNKLEVINDHRRKITNIYSTHYKLLTTHSNLPLQKFSLFTKNAKAIRKQLKKQNIHLNDGWTGCVVCPANVDLSTTGYEKGMDPSAEGVCLQILSLPTHPGMSVNDAKRLISIIDDCL